MARIASTATSTVPPKPIARPADSEQRRPLPSDIPPAQSGVRTIPGFAGALVRELARYVTEVQALAVVSASAEIAGISRGRLGPAHLPVIAAQVRETFALLGVPDSRRDACLSHVRALCTPAAGAAPEPALTVAIEHDDDIVRARQAGRQISAELGFSEVAIVKLATAISELARNMLKYAGKGTIALRLLGGGERGVEVVATDRGPGIPDLSAVLKPGFRSKTGMGAGLRGTRALMDFFYVSSRPGLGTVVTIRKLRT